MVFVMREIDAIINARLREDIRRQGKRRGESRNLG